jgi:hypothetical protein
MRYSLDSMIAGYLCEIDGQHGRFRVYSTWRPDVVIFSMLDRYGAETGLMYPVPVDDLREDVAYAVRHAISYDARENPSLADA